MGNLITAVIRQRLNDEMCISQMPFSGRISDVDFLGRLYDLKALPSYDGRFPSADGDIYQHTVNNDDWDCGWMFSDSRFNLLYCEDEVFLKFLSETIHPAVRTNPLEVEHLRQMYNRHLSESGFEIIQTDEIAQMPVFSGIRKDYAQAHLMEKKAKIKKLLDSSYVESKVKLMNDSIAKDTDLALGTAKELIETICKSILSQKAVSYAPDLTIAQLLKITINQLDFTPKHVSNPEIAHKSILQVLAGIKSMIQGLAELRNEYGTGHGKTADFKGLEPKYARLLVALSSEVAILLLSTNGEGAELIEDDIKSQPSNDDDLLF